MLYRDALKKDLAMMLDIEKDSFNDAWSYASFASCLENPFCEVLVAELSDGSIVAYAVMMHMYEQAEIVRVAVDRKCLREGIASALVERLVDIASASGVETIFLDVRESNKAARSLYEKLGFISYEVAPNFYNKPQEASIKMRKSVSNNIM